MEKEREKTPTDFVTLGGALKSIVKEELSTAFGNEIKSYNEFILIYNQALINYQDASDDFKKNKLITSFLYKNIQVNEQISQALINLSNTKEPLFLPNALRTITKKVLNLYAELGRDEQSAFFSLLSNIQKEQEDKRSFIEKTAKRFASLFTKSSTLDPSNKIHSIMYVYFEQSFAQILNENEQPLFEVYKKLAEFSQFLWDDFNDLTTLTQKLDAANYNYDSLAPSDFEKKQLISSDLKLKEIQTDFNRFSENLAQKFKNSILNFDFHTLSSEKISVFAIDEIITKKETHFRKLEKSKALWRNTRLVFTEDLSLELEIFTLKYQIIHEYFDFIKSYTSNFNIPFIQNLEVFATQFNLLKTYFEDANSQSIEKDIQDNLHKLKLQLKKELIIKTMPLLQNQLNSPKLISEIDAFENLVETSFSALSENRYLMKKPDYSREVKTDEIESISPNDLISFEIKPNFIQIFPAFKRTLIKHNQTLLNQLNTAPNIAIFSLESASGLYENQKDIKEIYKICLEGIARSILKVEETKQLNDSFFENETEKIRLAINTFVNSLSDITNNENALQIKYRIVKAKAIAHSKEVKDKFIANLLNLVPILLEKLKALKLFIEDLSQKIARQFALDKTRDFISTDISDYLNTTETAISKLPFVYQRLFSFEPLESFNLYIERRVPMETFNLAYAKWKEGKFSPVVLIGEKGSGKTTFLRKFLKTTISNEKVFVFNLLENNKKPADIYHEIIDGTGLTDLKSDNKKIIVLDGLERLFEAKINGFNYLTKLFNVISETRKEVFWIVSVHETSWNFIDKSVQASNYFGYHIRLNDLDYNELVNLIESRHNLSGYKIRYVDNLRKKSFLNIKKKDSGFDEEELRKSYFNLLIKNVQGNILQAYIYWLRSLKLDESTILVNNDNQLEFDFVRGIPQSKLLLLKSILIHSGLSADKMSEIFRIDQSQCDLELKQLDDDGILTSKNKLYFINPLIYRQLIKHLNNINLLH